MDLKFIGIGGAFNNELGCNCAYIKENKSILFIDFGMDVFNKVIRYNLLEDVENVYICLTHFHGDHIGGVFTFVDYCFYYKKIVVQFISDSLGFTNKLVKLLELTGIESTKFNVISSFLVNFDFSIEIVKTTHSPLLDCYSLVFKKDNFNVLYTSDTNDIDFVKEKMKDDSFVKIYCEVGENSSLHIEYEDLLKIKNDKLVLMHFQNMELYNRAINDGFNVPNFLK